MEKKQKNHEQSLENIKNILTVMSHGSVTLVIQDNYVVQIEKNEKIRLK